jgi:glycosyltransferase involved in cell wall biosynthesis
LFSKFSNVPQSEALAPYLTVVVPTFQLRSRIGVTLRSLEVQTLDPSKFEIIFVDDGSQDGTADVVESWRPALSRRILRNVRNCGRGATRNRGWQEAKGNIIVFLDGDMIAHPRLLETHYDAFTSPQVDVVSGRRWCLDLSAERPLDETVIARLAQRTSAQDLFLSPDDFDTLRTKSILGQLPGQTELEVQIEEVCTDYPGSLTSALAFITSNVAVRRELLCATHGFRPLLARGEDTDLGIRLAQRGARFAYAEGAEAIHPLYEMGGRVDEYRHTFDTIITRYPFKVVALWWCWAQQPGAMPFGRLSDIARVEADGELADLDIHVLAQEKGLTFQADFSITHEALAQYRAWVGQLPIEQVAAWLDKGVQRGLLSRPRSGASKLFDLYLTTSWLDDHSEWRQHLYKQSFIPRHLTRRQLGQKIAPPLSVYWRGRYSMELPAELIPAEGAAVSLPLPIVTRYQNEVQLISWDPPDLASYIQQGMVIGYPVRPPDTPTFSLSYSFSCTVSEFDRAMPHEATEEDPSLWLRPVSLREFQMLASIVGTILPSRCDDPEIEAHKIYDWLLENTEYCANRFDGLWSIHSGLGHCIQLSRFFVALCRIAGIPARERHGALIDWDCSDAEVYRGECRAYQSPFLHTWAEFHSKGHGWIPVELLPVAHGQRVATPWNFPDPVLREQLYSEQSLYDAYYFGGLDPFRIHGPQWSARTPQLAERYKGSWRSIPDPNLSIRHSIQAEGIPRS